MTNIQEIFSLLTQSTQTDKALVQKAYDFALHAHRDQKRKSGEPYFVHLFETAKILADLGMSATTISAGLLHDSIEDVGVALETIEKEFGKDIGFIVDGVTKLGHLKYRGTARHSESLRKLFLAMAEDARVIIVKLSDRLHNMRTLQYVPEDKRLRIAKETLEIYAPLAYRLGIRKLNRELEDTAFKYVYPSEYAETVRLVHEREGSETESLEKFLKSLKKELAANNITNFHTEHRIKGLYSLYKKLKRNGMDIDKIHDLAALRVIVPSVSECYQVLGIIHGAWRPLPGRIKDYIAFPKPNGYQALHTTIFNGDGGLVEVQIKTEAMYHDSEYGIASHIGYKQETNEGIKPNSKTTQNALWTNLMQSLKTELAEEENVRKIDFFKERIFVFTPKGDVIDLPFGSSVIDFAYSIHSEVGNTIAGAKVNGKFVAIYTTLKNGDRIEIETKKSAKPSRKWLESAKTTMAKKHIRISLTGSRK